MMFDSLSLTFVGQVIAALVGTSAFAILFGVPRKYYLSCGIVGSLGWILYLILTRYLGATPTEATLCATVLVTLVSRTLSVLERCPVTIFIICGIFPLVPGGGIFWTTYYIISNQLSKALESGFSSIKIVIAIVVGIILITDIPNKFFIRIGRLVHNRS